MQQLNSIYVYEAIRNDSKIGKAVQLTLNITTPLGNSDKFILEMPSSQITTNS